MELWGRLCQATKAEPPLGAGGGVLSQQSLSWQISNPARTPLDCPGGPSTGRAGTGREQGDSGRSRCAVGGRHGARSWERGGMVAKPQKNLPAVWLPCEGCAGPPGRLCEVFGLPGTGGTAPPWPGAKGSRVSGAWGGRSTQRCCPSAGWEIPSCPSGIPLPPRSLLFSLPQQGLLVTLSSGLASIGVARPSLSPPRLLPRHCRDGPDGRGHPLTHPAVPGCCRPFPGLPPGCQLSPT